MGSKKKTVRKVVEKEKTYTEPEIVEEEVEVAVCDFCDMEYTDMKPEDLNELHFNPRKEYLMKMDLKHRFGVRREFEKIINGEGNGLNIDIIPYSNAENIRDAIDDECLQTSDYLGQYDKYTDKTYVFNINLPEIESEAVMRVCDNCKKGIQGN